MSSEARDSSSRFAEALDRFLSGVTGNGSAADSDESTTERASFTESDAGTRGQVPAGADPLLSAPGSATQTQTREEPAESAGPVDAPVETAESTDAPTKDTEAPAKPAEQSAASAEALADDAYELPTIVPATEHTPGPEARGRPTLPTGDPSERTAPVVPASQPAGAPAIPPASPTGPTSRPTAPTVSQLRSPGRRPRVRRVTRVVRHIDPWSTFKVAIIFNLVAYVVCLTSGVLLWRVADSTGTLDNIERWFTQFGWETFELKGGEIFDNAWMIGLFAVVVATGGAVLLVTLFNLVSDIVGGVRLTVLEEEVVERTVSSTRRYVVRRPTDADAASSAQASDWSADDLDDGDEPSEPSRPTADSAGHGATHGRAAEQPPTADWSVD